MRLEDGVCVCPWPLVRPSPAGDQFTIRHAVAAGPSPPTTGGSTTPSAIAPTAIGSWTPRWSACRASNGWAVGSFRRRAFGDVRAARALLQQATERASEILTPRQVLALQLYCEGQPMTAIAARLGLRSRKHVWAAYRRPAAEAVTREFVALAQAEFPSNSS